MNVLLIGGNGFIGSAIARHFIERGDGVVSVSRGTSKPQAGVEPLIANRKHADEFAHAIEGRWFDIAVDLTAFHASDIDAVVPALLDQVGRYILISTDFVYATDVTHFPIDEESPKDTVSGYALGKLECERRLSEIGKEIAWSVLRPPHVIGAGRELGTGSVQGRDWELLTSLINGTGLTFIGDGSLLVQPVWHRQIARAVEAVANTPGAVGMTFNVCDNHAITIKRYYQIICDLIGAPLRYETTPIDEYRRMYPQQGALTRHRAYDTSRLRGVTGYNPGAHIEEALKEAVVWLERRPLVERW